MLHHTPPLAKACCLHLHDLTCSGSLWTPLRESFRFPVLPCNQVTVSSSVSVCGSGQPNSLLPITRGVSRRETESCFQTSLSWPELSKETHDGSEITMCFSLPSPWTLKPCQHGCPRAREKMDQVSPLRRGREARRACPCLWLHRGDPAMGGMLVVWMPDVRRKLLGQKSWRLHPAGGLGTKRKTQLILLLRSRASAWRLIRMRPR